MDKPGTHLHSVAEGLDPAADVDMDVQKRKDEAAAASLLQVKDGMKTSAPPAHYGMPNASHPSFSSVPMPRPPASAHVGTVHAHLHDGRQAYFVPAGVPLHGAGQQPGMWSSPPPMGGGPHDGPPPGVGMQHPMYPPHGVQMPPGPPGRDMHHMVPVQYAMGPGHGPPPVHDPGMAGPMRPGHPDGRSVIRGPRSAPAAEAQRVGRRPKVVPFESVAATFNMPIEDAARVLGVCTTVVKKVCRTNGIKRWPFRKIKAVVKPIMQLQQRVQQGLATAAEVDELQRLLYTSATAREEQHAAATAAAAAVKAASGGPRSGVGGTGSQDPSFAAGDSGAEDDFHHDAGGSHLARMGHAPYPGADHGSRADDSHGDYGPHGPRYPHDEAGAHEGERVPMEHGPPGSPSAGHAWHDQGHAGGMPPPMMLPRAHHGHGPPQAMAMHDTQAHYMHGPPHYMGPPQQHMPVGYHGQQWVAVPPPPGNVPAGGQGHYYYAPGPGQYAPAPCASHAVPYVVQHAQGPPPGSQGMAYAAMPHGPGACQGGGGGAPQCYYCQQPPAPGQPPVGMGAAPQGGHRSSS